MKSDGSSQEKIIPLHNIHKAESNFFIAVYCNRVNMSLLWLCSVVQKLLVDKYNALYFVTDFYIQ